MAGVTTATFNDMVAALRKRLTTNGHALSDGELTTLAIDIANVVNNDSANVTSHAVLELSQTKVRPFVTGV